MTEDRHDAQVRNLVAELAASAPPAPAFSRIADRLSTTARGAHMPAADHVDGEPGDESLDLTPSYVTERPQRSRPWRLMAAFVAFLLATAGGVFAYGSLTGDDGTETPEAAVEKFVDAFVQSDVSGMLEALAPSERVILRESLEVLNSQASRLELTKDLDLDDVSGVELEVTGLELSSAGLGEGVATVNVTGTVRSTANDRELPLGDVARDLLVDSLPDNGYQGVADDVDEAINREAGNGIKLVTLKEADGWHVSVWYTAAEYLRRDQGLPVPTFGRSPVTPVGADSPEAAFRALLEATGDYNKMVGLTTPEESRVLYDYVPVWSAQNGNPQNTSNQKVHNLETHGEGDGDRRTVHIDAYDVEWTSTYTYTEYDSDGNPTPNETTETSTSRYAFDGDCFTSTYESDYAPEEAPETDKICRAEALANGMSPLTWDLIRQVQVTAERHDGRWFLSPLRSLVGETVAQLALVPDSQTLSDLNSAEDSSGYLLLPYDVLGFAFGSPLSFGPAFYSGLEPFGSTSESSSGSSEGQSGTLGPGPPEEVPTTVLELPEPPAPSTTDIRTTAPETTAPTTATLAPSTSVPATTAPAAPLTGPSTTGG